MPKRWSTVRLQSASADDAEEWGIELSEDEPAFSHRLPSTFPDKALAKAEIRKWKEAKEEDKTP